MKQIISLLFSLIIFSTMPVYAAGESHNAGVMSHAEEKVCLPEQFEKGLFGKMHAALATSGIMHQYNRLLVKICPAQGAPASEAMQALGKEAQTAVGVSPDRQVPIQHIPGADYSAIADLNAIFIGDELLSEEVAYGVKRCNMFHEAVHIKYHDCSFSSTFYLGSLAGVLLAMKQIIKPQGKLKLLYLPALVVGHCVGRALQRQFGSYRERHADIEGHYATQCHTCVTEKIEDVRPAYESVNSVISCCNHTSELLNSEQTKAFASAKNWIEQKKRYLSIEENEIIAAELKQGNKICTFHEQAK